MKTFIVALAAVVGLAAFASSAEAARYRYGYGHYGYRHVGYRYTYYGGRHWAMKRRIVYPNRPPYYVPRYRYW